MQVTFPDGTVVQATGLGRPEADPTPHFGLYADDAWAPAWPHEMIDWSDYGLPDDEGAAFAAIRAAWQRARSGELVEIGCAAGVGRTGTVLACMAVLAGISGDEAVGWGARELPRRGRGDERPGDDGAALLERAGVKQATVERELASGASSQVARTLAADP